MNELVKVEQRPVKSPVKSGGRIAAMIPSDIDQAYRMAQALASSGMTPKAFANDANKILVGIIAGMEVGLAPFQALQSIAVINGNPTLWGDGALALIQGSGMLVDIEETDDGVTATCRLVRKDRPTPIVRQFSNAMAQKAGLLGKPGPWTQYQARMRQMRARSWAMRDGFPDVLKGIGIAEEVRDIPVDDTQEYQPRMTRQMLASHADVQASDPQPAEPEQVEATPTVEQQDAGDEIPAWRASVDEHLSRVRSAKAKNDVHDAIDQFAPHMDMLPDDERALISAEHANALGRFSTISAG